MWVMNQDSLAVIEINALAIEPVDIVNNKNEGKVRVWGTTSNEHDYLLGVYNNLDDAIYVINDFANIAAAGEKGFYQMPSANSVGGNA